MLSFGAGTASSFGFSQRRSRRPQPGGLFHSNMEKGADLSPRPLVVIQPAQRRLTKGPPEFREDRVDQPKAKA
jgi:hypothetical protein